MLHFHWEYLRESQYVLCLKQYAVLINFLNVDTVQITFKNYYIYSYELPRGVKNLANQDLVK